ALQPIEYAMVEGEAEVHHRLDTDHPVHGQGSLDARLHGQDPRLAGIDDRIAEQRSEGPGIVDGKGPSGQVVRLELLVPRARGAIVEAARKPRDRRAV